MNKDIKEGIKIINKVIEYSKGDFYSFISFCGKNGIKETMFVEGTEKILKEKTGNKPEKIPIKQAIKEIVKLIEDEGKKIPEEYEIYKIKEKIEKE